LVVVVSIAVAAALAGWMRRVENHRTPQPTACSRVVQDVFANGTGNTEDTVRLGQLLEHQEQCLGDAEFVHHVRRLMVATQQFDLARKLLADAAKRNALKPDELTAQVAWVDLAEAHYHWTTDNLEKANALHAKAMASAKALRTKWPEWAQPYLILDEGSRLTWPSSAKSTPVDYYKLEREEQKRLLNGAFVRSMSDLQLSAFIFITAGLGMLAGFAGVSGLWALRDMAGYATSAIGSARPGYVEFKGTLHTAVGMSPLIGAFSHEPAVWYDVESKSGSKPVQTTYQRSAQVFVVRDPTGNAIIEPQDMTVRTRHVVTKFRNSGGLSATGRTTERSLKEGDSAYVLGELIIQTDASGKSHRIVRQAANGKRLLVSNYSEDRLMLFEKLWLAIGGGIFLFAIVLLVWTYYQRSQITTIPGMLR